MSVVVEHDPKLLEVNPPLVAGNPSYHDISERISTIIEPEVGQTPMKYWITLGVTSSLTVLLGAMLAYLAVTGIGVWGNNRPVGWAWDITNFVFWIGIGHAGTLISAILFLFRQKWRTSINRSAEAMTLFAVMCAGIFPLFHTGRPWRAYWLFPVPNTDLSMWQNFRSPLIWDVFAVSTYFTVSVLFWFVGLIPDLATIRDRVTPGLRQRLFSIFSLGWNGSYRVWQHYEVLYLLLAGLATPLVVSVHTIVSWDFATAVIPGWHATIFPPYFVAGAIFSGIAMVLTLMIVARKVMNLEDYITPRHVDVMCKLLLLTSSIVALAYGTEFFTAFYSGNPYETFVFRNRALGPFAWAYWTMVSCNVLVPQSLWFPRIRRRLGIVFVLSLLINVGMWFERFVIIVTSLHRDFLPS